MQEIKELILLIDDARLQLLVDDNRENTGISRLLENIRNGRNSVMDATAEDTLKGNAGFREIKLALIEKLIASVDQFLDELSQSSDVRTAHIEAQKFWLNIRSMSRQNAGVLVLRLAERLLEIAEKFDLDLLCLDVSLFLRIRYCRHTPDSDRCVRAEQKYQYFRRVHDAGAEVEKAWVNGITLAVNPSVSREAVLEMARKQVGLIQPLMRDFPVQKVHLYGYLVELTQHTAALDYAQAMRCCDKAIRFFQERSYLALDPLQVFHYHRLICSIHLRQFETGRQSATECLELTGDDYFNRVKINELYMLLALHTRHYAETVEVFVEANSNPEFDFLPDISRATWALYGSYLHYLYDAGLLDTLPGPRTGLDLPMQKSDFETGETRLTTARAAVEFLSLLQQKRYDDLPERVEMIQKYAENFLDNDRTRRSYLFLYMLSQLPAGQFQRALVVPLAAPFLSKLQTAPLTLANQTEELEIIPYEDLWNLALESL